MPIFQAKARTADTYLAGIGASGALIASAFVTFMILVGAVTFDAWPRAARLIDRGNAQVSIGTAPTSTSTSAPSRVPTANVLGGNGPKSGGGGGTSSQRVHPARAPKTQGSLGGSVNTPGSTGEQTPTEGTPPSQGPSEPGPRTIIGQTVSSAGNTVEATTDSVGNVLGGSGEPGLGGTVGSLGETINGTLQGLAGGL
jgi:hypothetical protein